MAKKTTVVKHYGRVSETPGFPEENSQEISTKSELIQGGVGQVDFSLKITGGGGGLPRGGGGAKGAGRVSAGNFGAGGAFFFFGPEMSTKLIRRSIFNTAGSFGLLGRGGPLGSQCAHPFPNLKRGCSQSELQVPNLFSCSEECGEVFGDKFHSKATTMGSKPQTHARASGGAELRRAKLGNGLHHCPA